MYQDFGIVIVGGGSSQRFGENKLLISLNEIPVIIHCLRTFLTVFKKEQLVVVVEQKLKDEYQKVIREYLNIELNIINGGVRRQDSALNGINYLSNYKFIGVHDAARPYLSVNLLKKLLEKVYTHNCVICGKVIIDTVKKTDENGRIIETLDRNTLCATETPQFSLTKDIQEAYMKYNSLLLTDEAMALEKAQKEVYIYKHNEKNYKLTYKEDLNV